MPFLPIRKNSCLLNKTRVFATCELSRTGFLVRRIRKYWIICCNFSVTNMFQMLPIGDLSLTGKSDWYFWLHSMVEIRVPILYIYYAANLHKFAINFLNSPKFATNICNSPKFASEIANSCSTRVRFYLIRSTTTSSLRAFEPSLGSLTSLIRAATRRDLPLPSGNLANCRE